MDFDDPSQKGLAGAAPLGFVSADEFLRLEQGKENFAVARQGAQRDSISRRSLTGGGTCADLGRLSEDLQKLQSEFSSLQEQLHQLPRRETLDSRRETLEPLSTGFAHSSSLPRGAPGASGAAHANTTTYRSAGSSIPTPLPERSTSVGPVLILGKYLDAVQPPQAEVLPSSLPPLQPQRHQKPLHDSSLVSSSFRHGTPSVATEASNADRAGMAKPPLSGSTSRGSYETAGSHALPPACASSRGAPTDPAAILPMLPPGPASWAAAEAATALSVPPSGASSRAATDTAAYPGFPPFGPTGRGAGAGAGAGDAIASMPLAPAPDAGRKDLYDALLDSQRQSSASASGLGYECLLGSSSAKVSDSLFQFPAPVASSRAWQAASEVFEDPELTKLCDEGLHKQLKRTKDGATENSRIQELAGLAKLLRKCVRELGTRASMYVEQCMRMEKDVMKQVESMQLSSESSVKGLEAELAGAKKDLAQFEAGLKMDKATWGADLEMHKVEVSRLKRELERMSEERERARDDGQRAECARQHLEVEMKELRKTASQQIREVSVSQSEAVRCIMEDKIAVEKREATLKDENQRLAQRLEAASSCIEALQQELSLMEQVHGSLKDQFQSKAASEEALTLKISEVRGDLGKCQSQLSDARDLVNTLETSLQQQQQDNSRLQVESKEQQQELTQLKDRVADLVFELRAGKATWEEDRKLFADSSAKARETETALVEETAVFKSALAAALSQKEAVEGELVVLKKEHAALESESTNLKHQVEFAAGCQTEAEEKSAAWQKKLEVSSASLERTQKEIEEKGGRLDILEGEFAALKEVLGDCGQRDVVASLLTRISTLQGSVASAEATRRRIHNELVEIRGNIRVYCRVKPHPLGAARCLPDQVGISLAVDGKDHAFSYDRVFGADSTQEEVFASVSELVQSALDGYHVCLFSYGQTGAGKTHTMSGVDTAQGRGITPRAVEKILETAMMLREQEWEYTMEASFVEIYNNMLRDLLGGNAGYINDQNAIKHDPNGGHTVVVGVTKVPVKDAAAAHELIAQASAARACESTAMNSTSSRSHSVFMLYITGRHPPSGTSLQGCLCLVDLAGSERLDRSQVEDQRKKEACAINQSLSSLGDVFGALASKSSHIPYRNSKLTYLLQPCLGGHGKTLMFVNINPEPASAFETLCSLRFAAKVNGCETSAKGGAKRNASGPAASGPLAGDAKRLSLPGPTRGTAGAAAAPEQPTKRMSMVGQARGAISTVGSKRPSSSGIPTAGSKRVKPGP